MSCYARSLGVSKLRGSSALTSCFCERGARGSGSYAPRFTQLWSSVLVPIVLKISAIERSPLTILSYWSTGFECVAPCSCWEPAGRRYQLPSPQRTSSRSPAVFGYCVPWMWRTVEALQLYCLGWIYAGTYLRICESYSGQRETCFTA